MSFGWSKRPYTAPFMRDMVYNVDLYDDEHEQKGTTLSQTRFNKHISFSRKLSSLPLSTSSSGQFDGNGGCTSTLDVKSLVPATTFGDQCSNKMRDGNMVTLYLETDWKFSRIKEEIRYHFNIPVKQQRLYRDGVLLSDNYDKISDVNFKSGDVILVKTYVDPYEFLKYFPPEPVFLSDDVIMKRATEFYDKYKPGSLEFEALKTVEPELVKAIATGDKNEIFKHLKESYLKQHQENIEKRKKMYDAYLDPLNPESQKLIHKDIEMRKKDQNLIAAQKYLPESFGTIEMLYVKAEMNGVEFNALVDTGAQHSIMSKEVAQRCKVMDMVDERFSSVAIGVGSTPTLGKIHIADLKIGTVYLPMAITVMDVNNFEFILGLDVLRRYTCDINLKNNYLGINDVKVPFVSEAEVNRTRFSFNVYNKDDTENNEKYENNKNDSTSASSSSSKKSDSKADTKPTSPSAPSVSKESVVPSSSTGTALPNTSVPKTKTTESAPSNDVNEQKIKRLCETFDLDPEQARYVLEIANWDEELAASFMTE